MQMQVPRVYAAFVLCGLVLCTLHGATWAQTLSAPLTLATAISTAESVYIYNPASQSIVSPVEYTSELTMIPWQSYNTSMQWNFSLELSGPSVYINAVSPEAAGCSNGANAVWNAGKLVPVTTLCSPATSLYANFLFIPSRANNYAIVPAENSGACVTIVNNVPTMLGTVCNRLGAATQWQLVTISR